MTRIQPIERIYTDTRKTTFLMSYKKHKDVVAYIRENPFNPLNPCQIWVPVFSPAAELRQIGIDLFERRDNVEKIRL